MLARRMRYGPGAIEVDKGIYRLNAERVSVIWDISATTTQSIVRAETGQGPEQLSVLTML